MNAKHLNFSPRLMLFCSGGFAVILATAACQQLPASGTVPANAPVTVFQTVIHTVEVTRLVEVPVTVTLTPTPDESPTPSSTPTITDTPTQTPDPTSTPTYSPPRIRVKMWSACRYGPGVGYLYEYDLFDGNLMEVIGWREILAQQKDGTWQPSVWLYVRAVGGVNICWVNANLVDVVRGLTRSGQSVLMVEHHMDVVLDLADRVAVMHHGALLVCDTPATVMANRTVQEAYLGEEL